MFMLVSSAPSPSPWCVAPRLAGVDILSGEASVGAREEGVIVQASLW